MIKTAEQRRKIIYWLSVFSAAVKLENSVGFFDSNREAQEFYTGLGNLLFGFNLIELDTQLGKSNIATIDLVDDGKGICIQVTSDNTSDKIKSTLEGYRDQEKKIYEKYPKIIFWLIGQKKDYTANFNVKVPKENFDPTLDIWDDAYIAAEIGRISDIETLEKIEQYLKSNLETKSIFDISDSEIDRGLSLIKQGLAIDEQDTTASGEISYPVRGDGFMDKKNDLNKVDPQYYKDYVLDNIIFNDCIVEFLRKSANEDKKNDYFLICSHIQKHYESNLDKFSSIVDLIAHVFSESQNAITITDRYDARKLTVLLYNMYFSCDIGTNPND